MEVKHGCFNNTWIDIEAVSVSNRQVSSVCLHGSDPVGESSFGGGGSTIAPLHHSGHMVRNLLEQHQQ